MTKPKDYKVPPSVIMDSKQLDNMIETIWERSFYLSDKMAPEFIELITKYEKDLPPFDKDGIVISRTMALFILVAFLNMPHIEEKELMNAFQSALSLCKDIYNNNMNPTNVN